MTKQETYDVVTEDGVVTEHHIGKRPLTARMARQRRGDLETHSGHIIVNPLHRQPTIKEQFAVLKRSGELARLQKMADNLQKALEDHPDFEGYDRNELEELFITDSEKSFVMDRLARLKARDASDDEEPTPPADDPPQDPPAPKEGEA